MTQVEYELELQTIGERIDKERAAAWKTYQAGKEAARQAEEAARLAFLSYKTSVYTEQARALRERRMELMRSGESMSGLAAEFLANDEATLANDYLAHRTKLANEISAARGAKQAAHSAWIDKNYSLREKEAAEKRTLRLRFIAEENEEKKERIHKIE